MITLGSPIVLVGSLVAYLSSFLAWRRGHSRTAVTLLLFAAFLLRLYAAGDGFLHAWDERYHALVAKNLVSHPLRPTLYETPLLPYDPHDWLSNHVWLHKPPFALWLMGLSMAVFGNVEWALRLPSLLLSTAAVYATYRLGVAWKGPDVGFVAATFQSLNAFLVLLAAGWFASDHVDTASVSLVGLAIAAVGSHVSAGAFALLGLGSGLAVLSKWLPGLLALFVGLVWHARSESTRRLAAHAALAAAVAAAVILPWWLFASRAYPVEWSWESRYSLGHFFEVLEGHGGSALYHLALLPKIYGELVYVPLAFFFYCLWRAPRDARSWALAAWIVLPYAVYSFAATKMPAYVMIAAPAVFLLEADFVCRLLTLAPTRRLLRRGAAALLAILVAALPVRILLNDLRLFRPYDRQPAWADELRELGTRLAGSQAVILGAPRPIETMFYTSQTAYSYVPDRATVTSLATRGYRVVVCETPRLPADARGWPEVEYVELLDRTP